MFKTCRNDISCRPASLWWIYPVLVCYDETLWIRFSHSKVVITQSHRNFKTTATALRQTFWKSRPISQLLCCNVALPSQYFCTCCSGVAWPCTVVAGGQECFGIVAVLSLGFWPAFECITILLLWFCRHSQWLLNVLFLHYYRCILVAAQY